MSEKIKIEVEQMNQRKETYLASPNFCPLCKSDNIKAGVWHPESHYQEVECKDCKATWDEVFKMVDVEISSGSVNPAYAKLNTYAPGKAECPSCGKVGEMVYNQAFNGWSCQGCGVADDETEIDVTYKQGGK